MAAAVEYNGTTGTADAGYSSHVDDLNIFYDVCLPRTLFPHTPLTM